MDAENGFLECWDATPNADSIVTRESRRIFAPEIGIIFSF